MNDPTHMTADGSVPDRPTMSYADGESDDAQAMRVVDEMGRKPRTARAVLHQQQLRQAVGRTMNDPSMKPPAALRERINDLAATVSAASEARDQGPAVIGAIRRWAPLAVAAMLVIGVGTIPFMVLNRGSNPSAGASLIFSAQADYFATRHITCATSLDALMDDPSLPKSLEALPDSLTERFGAAPVGLDLSGLGYTFQAVGLCNAPGSGSVHLVYRALPDAGHDGSISLWIRSNNPDLDLEPGVVHRVTPDGAQYPLLVWRAGELDYWLIADAPEAGRRVADRLIQRL